VTNLVAHILYRGVNLSSTVLRRLKRTLFAAARSNSHCYFAIGDAHRPSLNPNYPIRPNHSAPNTTIWVTSSCSNNTFLTFSFIPLHLRAIYDIFMCPSIVPALGFNVPFIFIYTALLSRIPPPSHVQPPDTPVFIPPFSVLFHLYILHFSVFLKDIILLLLP
jgi:hypothetical protein